MSVRILPTGFRTRLGEGPTWIARMNSILWVDILGPKIHRFDLETEETSSVELPEAVGWIVERAGRGDFLIGLKSGIAEFDFASGKATHLASLQPECPDNRLNDAKVDSTGVLWAGTKDDTDATSSGALYRISTNLSPLLVDEGYGVTNGPTFSLDGRTMYHADSAARTVYAFDVDAQRNASNRREWVRFEDGWGYPDGMTTDAEGCVWIAHWDGGRLSRFAPDGTFLSSIAFPATNITSCCFGGANLDRLFVTSSNLGCEDEVNAGALFEVRPGVTGIAPTAFAG